jgi:glutamate dehydrogenase
MGPTFVHRTQQDTGADAATVARAYSIARECFEVRDLWVAIEALDNKVPAAAQYAMVQDTVALIRQVTYWLLQRHRSALGIEQQVGRLRPGIRELARSPAQWLRGQELESFQARNSALAGSGIPAELARRVAACSPLQCAPDIVELAASRKLTVDAAARAYFGVGAEFGLDWLRERIEALDIEGHWHAVARGSLREALYAVHRSLAERVLQESRERDPDKAVASWVQQHAAACAHARGVVNDIRAQQVGVDFASLTVALQSVRRLADTEV